MPFKVETGQGLEDANAYASVQQFKEYCQLRNIDLTGKEDGQIEGAIVQATDWLDNNYARSLLGFRAFGQQALEFPRQGVPDPTTGNQRPAGYMAPQVIKATCILAVEALKGSLYTNVTGTGQQVIEKTIGPITTKYNPVKPSEMVVQRQFDEARQAMAPLMRSFGLLQVSR